MKEEWKTIENFSSYKVSNKGRVYSFISDKMMKPYKTKKGYLRLNLKNDKGGYSKKLVHILVAKEFLLDPPNEDYQINHKNLDKEDNRISNLEWVTCKENVNHKIDNDPERLKYLKEEMSKIGEKYNSLGVEASKKAVMQIDKKTNEVVNIFESAREASRQIGANYKSISKVCNGKRKTHMGYKWEFYNK